MIKEHVEIWRDVKNNEEMSGLGSKVFWWFLRWGKELLWARRPKNTVWLFTNVTPQKFWF
jgi:hypothetical protein